jgi:hypothetical protein
MNTQLIIKALCCYRKAKNDSLKNNLKNNRTNIVEKRRLEIQKIDYMIQSFEEEMK